MSYKYKKLLYLFPDEVKTRWEYESLKIPTQHEVKIFNDRKPSLYDLLPDEKVIRKEITFSGPLMAREKLLIILCEEENGYYLDTRRVHLFLGRRKTPYIVIQRYSTNPAPAESVMKATKNLLLLRKDEELIQIKHHNIFVGAEGGGGGAPGSGLVISPKGNGKFVARLETSYVHAAELDHPFRHSIYDLKKFERDMETLPARIHNAPAVTIKYTPNFYYKNCGKITISYEQKF